MLWKKEVKGEPHIDESIDEYSEGSNDVSIAKLTAKVEKVNALMNFLMESKKGDIEKIARVNEQIGELRSSITEREKQIKNLEADAIKSIELVKEVKPEKLLLEVSKVDAKTQTIQAKLNNYEKISNSIIEEIKDVKTRIKAFRGTEEVIKLNQEVKKELIEIKKIASTVDINTNKVENIFTNIQKESADLKNIKENSEKLEELFKDVRKEFDDLKSKIIELKKIEHLLDIDTETIKRKDHINQILSEKEELKKLNQEIKGIWQQMKTTELKINDKSDKMENLFLDAQQRHLRFQDKLSSFHEHYNHIKKLSPHLHLYNKEETQSLKDHIHAHIRNGTPKTEIKKELLKQGWLEEIIDLYL